MVWFERCIEELVGVDVSAPEAKRLCTGTDSELGVAQAKCFGVMAARDMSAATRGIICSEITPETQPEMLWQKLACYDRVLWRGKTDRKFEVSSEDAATLCRKVSTRREEFAVETCWKDRAFDSYRRADLAMPTHQAVVICSNPTSREQKAAMLRWAAREHKPLREGI